MLEGPQAGASRTMSVLREVVGDLHPRSIVVVLLLLVFAALLSRFVNSVVRRTLERHRHSGTLLPESITRLQITRPRAPSSTAHAATLAACPPGAARVVAGVSPSGAAGPSGRTITSSNRSPRVQISTPTIVSWTVRSAARDGCGRSC